MSGKAQQTELLGVFAHLDALLEAIRTAKDQGLEIRDVYSPVPDDQIMDLVSPRRSPVRFLTFLGGLCGLAGGIALTEITSTRIWDLIVFGKPVTHVVPFLVVAFEGTILLGGVFTLSAMLLFGKLPFFEFPARGYRPNFSKDQFGLWLSCDAQQAQEAERLLTRAGAVEVEHLA